MTSGRFITFEGIEGSGKSSSIDHARSVLESCGLEVRTTREPGGTPLSEEIRRTLLIDRDVDAIAELLLVFAARRQHVVEVIEPCLENGIWVLSDRFTDATFAYQAGGRGLADDVVSYLADLTHPKLQPDLTLFFDLSVETALNRIQDRKPDRFEAEDVAFFERARQAYLHRAQHEKRFVVVDASADIESVHEEIGSLLREFAVKGSS